MYSGRLMLSSRELACCLIAVIGTAAILRIADLAGAADANATRLKRESFDNDPNWEGFNNRVIPKQPKIVKQDFGYSPTNHAGSAPGEMGGTVQRSTTPAYYAVKISPKSLNDHLTASGNFAITAAQGGAGVFFGFFNSK